MDALVQEVLEQHEGHSLFARADWEKDSGSLPQTSDDAVQMIRGQSRFVLHDPAISSSSGSIRGEILSVTSNPF